MGGGNIILRGLSGLWEVVSQVVQDIPKIVIRGSGGGGIRFSERLWTRVTRPVARIINSFVCPYCGLKIEENIMELARHIRESHSADLISISKVISRALSLGYSDIEALILPSDEAVPEKYAGKPLIAQEIISVRVKKERK